MNWNGRAVLAVSILLLVCVAIKPAKADGFSVTIGPAQGCTAACLGGTYTVTFTPVSGNEYTVTLTATTPTSGVAAGQYISSVEVGDSIGITSATLLSAPGGIGDWGGATGTIFGNLNNAGCNPGPAPNFCNNQNGPTFTQALANGNTYTWTWDVVYASALDTNPADVHIGLQYEDATGSNGDIVSVNGVGTSSVPEPGSVALLGIGSVGIVGMIRKRVG